MTHVSFAASEVSCGATTAPGRGLMLRWREAYLYTTSPASNPVSVSSALMEAEGK